MTEPRPFDFAQDRPGPAPEAPLTDAEIDDLIARSQRFLEGEPLGRLFPRERVVRAARAAVAVAGTPDRAARRFADRFDEAVAKLRLRTVSAAAVIGADAVVRIVRAAGELEPDEATIRALFAGPATEALLAAILYDGIVEFVKGMNPLGDGLSSFARRLVGGGGGGGGFLGGIVEQQVRSFIKGFVKIALERGVRFATDPQNRAMFRAARERMARLALERPIGEIVRSIPEEKLRGARDGAADWIRRRLELLAAADDAGGVAGAGAGGGAGAVAARWHERLAHETVASLAERWGLPLLDPRETAALVGPALRLFLERDRARKP